MTPDLIDLGETDQKELAIDIQTAVLRIDNVAWVSSPVS